MSPNQKAALAISSRGVGPDGRMRFSIRMWGLPSRNAVADPVPAVDRAVVEPQGLEARRPPVLELLEGIVIDLGREQGPEAGDVLRKISSADDLTH